MKNNFLLFILMMLFVSANSQTTIYSNNFTSGSSGWTLGQGGNFDTWIVNSNYSCASTTPNQGGGNYMHIYDDLGGDFCAHSGFYGSGSGGNVYATMTTAMVTTGLSNITISFDWLCQGQTGPVLASYGTIDYSIDGGNSWVNITTPLQKYNGQNTWTTASITSAAVPALANQADLRIRFGFTNSGYGTNPAFSIDNISVTSGGATGVGLLNQKNAITIYPNPSAGKFVIKLNTKSQKIGVEIRDAIGNLIQFTEEQLIDDHVLINAISIVPGVYFVTLHDGEYSSIQKLIISE